MIVFTRVQSQSDPRGGPPFFFLYIMFGYLLCHPALALAEVPFTATELLGRPTGSSVTVNVLPDVAVEYYFEYGEVPGALNLRTPETGFKTSEPDVPIEELLDGLASDTRYYYQMVYREPGESSWVYRDERSFHTARSRGSAFTFLVQSDSHMVGRVFGQQAFFENTLANESADNADFLIDVGDTLGGDDTVDPEQSVSYNLLLRTYFDQVGHSTPLFLVPGNHEGESGWVKDDTPPDNYAIWSTNTRKVYYPNPVPDSFYTGSDIDHPYIDGDGRREDYFAWEWGDALFVAIETYWYSQAFAPSDIWEWSLGQEQYEWLVETLRGSSARFKFVFTHQVISTQAVGRGGINYMGGEWSADTATFAANRPDWAYDISIHDLMVENEVSVLFHGHDHFFALEQLDGVYYQLIPFPSRSNSPNPTHYPDAIARLGSGGHLRVSVSPLEAVVEYVWSDPGGSANGDVVYSYSSSGSSAPASPGEAGLLELVNVVDGVRLLWGGDCGYGDSYNVYRGDLASGYDSLAFELCGVTDQEVTLPLGVPAAEFFLVVPTLDGSEGSYGAGSAGSRPPSTAPCDPQAAIDSCAN